MNLGLDKLKKYSLCIEKDVSDELIYHLYECKQISKEKEEYDIDKESICKVMDLPDEKEEKLENMIETDVRKECAKFQNKGFNICGNCIRKLYKTPKRKKGGK